MGYPKEMEDANSITLLRIKCFSLNRHIVDKEFINKEINVRKIDLVEVQEPQNKYEPMVESKQVTQVVTPQDIIQDTQRTCTSSRIHHELKIFGFLKTQDGNWFSCDKEPMTNIDVIMGTYSQKSFES